VVNAKGRGSFPNPEGPQPLESAARRFRVFAGYSGWGAGQLEAELEESSWIVEEQAPDLFAEPDEDLWGSVLRSKGGVYRVVALMPDDPSAN